METNLKQLALILMMALLTGCNDDSPSVDGVEKILIKTVDENKQSMEVEIARWWFSSKPEEKNDVSCDQKTCSEFLIAETINEAVTVYAHASKVQKNDEECWDFYEGELEVQPQQKEAMLILLYTATACK